MEDIVRHGVLPNGFRFYTRYDELIHVAGIGVRAGALHAPAGQNGLPHLVEHMLCRESHEYSDREADLMLEKHQCGPEENINVRIDLYSTFYGHDLLPRRHHLHNLFDLFAGFLKDRILDHKGLRTERAAIAAEYYLMGDDNLPNYVDLRMHQEMYDRNPARRRIDCDLEDLARIRLEDVQRFTNSHYVASNMFAVILGPSHRKAKEMAGEYFGVWPEGEVPKLDYDFSDTMPARGVPKIVEEVHDGTHLYHIAVGFPTEVYGSNDDEALDVLARIWAFRLRRILREGNQEWGKGAYRALTFTPRSFAHGMIYAWFATPSEEFARAGTEKILKECKNLQNKPVLDDELAEAKSSSERRVGIVGNDEFEAMKQKLVASHLDAFHSIPGTLAEMIIAATCNGDEEMIGLNNLKNKLKSIGKRQVVRVAKKYFSQEPVCLLVKPSKPIILPQPLEP